MANEPGSLPSPESDVAFPPVDPEISLQNQARLQERERRKSANPPTNSDNKYICVHPNPFEKPQPCADLVFDRKCEWNKHMDKHDRPFRCEHPDCSKLQGFTYPGGLARHEKEVHGKHGGPTAQLVCPFSNCKRSRGKKFTRKENLDEHIKRCHTFATGEEDEEEEGEDAEADESAIDQGQNQNVATLLASSQPDPLPANDATETTTTMPPATNASFDPENIDPAIAAAHEATSLATVAMDASATNTRKRKAASAFVFKPSPYEVPNGQSSGRGARRRKTNNAPEAANPPETNASNLFEELDRLRAENNSLQQELEKRDARIAEMQSVMNGFEQQSSG